MFLRRKIYSRYKTSHRPVPQFSDNWKFLLSIILTPEIHGHSCITQNWQSDTFKQRMALPFINKIFFPASEAIPSKLIYNFTFFYFTVEICGFLQWAYFVFKSLPLLFAVSQGSYLSFSVIQYWYNVLCHLERSFSLFMTFMHMINHSGWQFFPVQSSALFHLCLVYW